MRTRLHDGKNARTLHRMTRENKLALVVGFGLILFIGILVSDHFSVARNQASANLTNRQIDDPLVAHTRNEPDLIAIKPEPPPTTPMLQPADPAMNTSQMAAAGGSIEAMSPEQRSMVDRTVGLQQHGGAETALPASRDVQPVNTLAPQLGSAEITTLVSREQEQIQIPGFVPVEEGQTVNIKDVRFHDVRGGESLFAICKEYYGDTALVQALAQFNKMNDPGQVRAGRRLLIPTAESLGGKSRAAPSQAAPSKSSALRPTAVASNTKSGDQGKRAAKTYTVKHGDSLSAIAQRMLGDREKWRDLHRINRKVIDDPDNIRAGTVLKLG